MPVTESEERGALEMAEPGVGGDWKLVAPEIAKAELAGIGEQWRVGS